MAIEKPLYQKLYYKTGSAIVLQAPEEFDLGVDAHTGELVAGSQYDFALIFILNMEQLFKELPKLLPALKPDTVFWVAYPKQTSKVKTDLNRDILWRLMEERSDYRIVSNVAIDDTWSALRFRHSSVSKK